MASDLDALLRLEQHSFPGDRLSRRSLRHLLRGQHSRCLVAESETGTVIGYLVLLQRRGTSLARIYSLAVDDAWRGRGVGSLLLARAEEAARRLKCLFMRLEVRVDNPAAITLYRKHGYRAFQQVAGYYDDGGAALRLEKRLEDPARTLDFSGSYYAQTTPFTCGPAALMMAMSSLEPGSCPLDRRTEMQLWREATTIFMTTGHGGCSPEGLALSASQRDFRVTLYRQCADIPFIDSVRDVRKKRIIQLVHEDFMDRIGESEIELHDQAISPEQFAAHLTDGAALVTLISTWRLNRNRAPHWVYVTAVDEGYVYLNDPEPDEESLHPYQDCIGLPVPRKDFERMACFGRSRLKATLVLNRSP